MSRRWCGRAHSPSVLDRDSWSPSVTQRELELERALATRATRCAQRREPCVEMAEKLRSKALLRR